MSSHQPTGGKSTSQLPLENFSLVLGGPLYQLWSRAHLGNVSSHLRLRIVTLSALCWLPLLLLSAWEGTLLEGVAVPFLLDIESQARFLICVPLLVFAELIVHQRIRGIIAQFLERQLVPDASLPRFNQAIGSAMAWRNSVAVELALLLFVFSSGYFIRTNTFVLDASTWYVTQSDGQDHLSFAGIWFFWISIPITQFLVLRWLYRILIWSRLLWQLSCLPLALIPTHPDRNAGLGFLGASAYAYSPLLTAFGAQLAGYVANRILHDGAVLTAYKPEIALLVVVGLLLVLAPLTVFASQIMRTKRQGMREYGALAAEYTRDFERRWLRSQDRDGEALLGAADIQSLADLGNAYAVVKEIRPLPFSRDTFMQLILATLVPFVPLLFTLFPFEVMLDRVIGIIF
ncbi:hypothetical protein [Aeromonas hydrophila]|uniref:hypothetical protein n=1 Tax=Aeromonas hydrophila TaxID=644 RepID=UPI00236701C1|nr:hypothetical protein [Aeromonas hydrophila]WDF90938.1 hypothetical protein PUB83_01290 [Aeromonas hydrophila subsp. hydrophila]